MRKPPPSNTLRRVCAWCVTPLLALALSAGEPTACEVERRPGSGASSSATGVATGPRLHVRGKAGDRHGVGRARKSGGGDRLSPRSTPDERRRGGIGALIGISLA